MVPTRRLLLIAAIAAGLVAALGWARPDPGGAPLTWSGADTAAVAAWALAVAAATWLAVVALVCVVALKTERPALARAAAHRAPRVLRRAVEAALAASLLVGSAAGAAPVDEPVVRAPRAASSLPSPTTTTLPDTPVSAPPTTTPVTTPAAAAERPVVRAPAPPPVPVPQAATPDPAAPEPISGGASHMVVAGDNLWRIARDTLIAHGTGRPDDATVARYWRRVIDANRTTLRSGNPSLIYPGEIVALPQPV